MRPLIFLFVCLFSAGAWATAAQVGLARVAFEGHGPAGFRLEGVTDALELRDAGGQWVFTVPLATLKTGIALRDRHMREKYLQTDRFPQAVLALSRDAVPLPDEGQTRSGTAPAELTLHGQTRPVQVAYSISRSGGRYQIAATVPLDMGAFGIEQPSYLGLTVQPEVVVNATLAVQMSP